MAHASPRGDRVDLHCHSTASDGTYTPEQLVNLAIRTGLAALALTDHDTVAGVLRARQAAGGRIEIVVAVELSCEWEGREIHLLGYDFDLTDAAMTSAMTRLCADRVARYDAMVARLQAMGVTLPDPAPGPVPGRRHLAAALVTAGQVNTVREAFHRYLDDGGPADVPKTRLPLFDAIELIRAAGGVPSLAHPGPRVNAAWLRHLADHGLGAVEAEYPTFSRSRSRLIRGWAEECGLAVTGGSDCHGPEDSRRSLGTRSITLNELGRLREHKELARC